METVELHVEIQGMTPDLSRATGSFDPIDLGTVPPERLAAMLAAMTRLPLPPETGGELCFPNLLVAGPLGRHSFEVADDRGSLYSPEAEANVTVDQAMIMVTGKPFRGAVSNPPPPPRFAVAPAPPPPGWAPVPPPPLPRASGHHPGRQGPPGSPASGPAPVSAGPPAPAHQPAFCSACGSPLQPGQNFCPRCGTGVGAVPPPAGFSPPPPPAWAAPVAGFPPPPPPPGGFPAAPSAPSALASVDDDPQVSAAMEALVQMAAQPVGLGEFRTRCPWLSEGENSRLYRQALDRLLAVDPGLHASLSHPPRDWGILKPGLFRRLLTLFIDLPAVLTLIVTGVLLVGPVLVKNGLDDDGAVAGLLAFAWFFSAWFGYFALFEMNLGASLGGLLLGVRVADGYGNPPSFGLCFMRQFTRVLGLLAIVLALSANTRRRPYRGTHTPQVNAGMRAGVTISAMAEPGEVVLA